MPLAERIVVIAWLVHLALVAFLLSQHELWRDELQAWSIADSSRNPLTVIANTRLEGRPPLWHLLIWPITQITNNPNWMNLLTFFIGALASWLWIRNVRLPIFLRIAFLFGFHLTGGYLAHAREYVLLFLLLTVALISAQKHGFGWRTTAAIGALAMVNLFGLLMAGAVTVAIGVPAILAAVRSANSNLARRMYLQMAMLASVFSACAYWIYPTDKNQFQGIRYHSFGIAISESMTPFAVDWQFFNRINDVVAIVILLAIVGGLFLTSRAAGIFAACASVLLLANSTFGYATYWWHWGNVLIALACAPIIIGHDAKLNAPAAKILRVGGYSALALGSLLANYWGPGKQIYTTIPYSMSGATAAAIKSICPTDCTIIVDWDATGAAISAQLGGRSLYYLNRGEFGTFAKYVNTNKPPTWESAIATMNTFERPILIATDLLLGPAPPELEGIATPWGGFWDNAFVMQLATRRIVPED